MARRRRPLRQVGLGCPVVFSENPGPPVGQVLGGIWAQDPGAASPRVPLRIVPQERQKCLRKDMGCFCWGS